MKGVFEIAEFFLKIIQIAYVAVMLLAMFFYINHYNLYFMESGMQREALVIGDGSLSAECLAETTKNGYQIKALLSEEKIKAEINRRLSKVSCLKYNKGIFIEIYDQNNKLIYYFGNSTICSSLNPCVEKSTTKYSEFPAALNKSVVIEPIKYKFFIGTGV